MLRWRNGVHPVLTGEGGAVLDERTGRWTYLSADAAVAADLLTNTDTTQATTGYAQRMHVTAQRAARDITSVASTLTARGLLVDGPVRTRRWWRR